MFEKYLIEHCSPTLASIKTANLFSYTFGKDSSPESSIEFWNKCMSEKGIELILLRKRDSRALIYVCRRKKLCEDLSKDGVAEFLREFGYCSTDADYSINRLKTRISESFDFPHEIGVFLGYPLDDVKGFIENAGANSKCTGCWKVYCNECEAVKIFEKYKKCREVYSRLWHSGARNILELTVAA